jgi:hypothetical protein
LANSRYRAPDPFLDARHQFVFRRIAADSQKIELGADAAKNAHQSAPGHGLRRGVGPRGGSVPIKALQADLEKRPRGWLNAAAEVAVTRSSAIIGNGGTDAASIDAPTAILHSICDLDPWPFR